MKQFIILILISAMALVFTQCSVKPSKRTHNNAVGIWVGTSDLPDRNDEDYKIQSWAVGVNIKHLNPKVLCNSFFNANSGIHFGKSYGISVDASFNLLTDDLFMKMDGDQSSPVQFYAGPGLGASLINKNGKHLSLDPKLGFAGGMSILFPPSGKYHESDFSMEGMMMDKIFQTSKKHKANPDGIVRIMYNSYLF